MYKTNYWYVMLIVAITYASTSVYAQTHFKAIALPPDINKLNEEFSGMTMYDNRLYLLPQYGDNREFKLDSPFTIYSILADSIGRVIDGKDEALTAYRQINVKNLDKLKSVEYYQGFEAITIVNNTVFLSIETNCKGKAGKAGECYDYCFILKGSFNASKNEILIDSVFQKLKRPVTINNAGFESMAWLPNEKKLLAYYEFNATAKGGDGYLIDTSLNKEPEQIKTPFLYFRITDIAATNDDKIYGINYSWSGDYNAYLSNDIIKNQEKNIRKTIPDLNNNLANNPDYLKTNSYARIVMLNNRNDKQWKQVTSAFPIPKNNWEGIALYRKGALIITDANNNPAQLSTFGYVAF